MAYIQKPKSSCLKKALVGNQHNLPEFLKEEIKATPESPAKKKGGAPSRKKSKGYYNEVRSKTKEGAAAGGGMTQAGVNKYKKDNPGSKLKTAVTNCKAKVGTKPYKRQKAFCSRSKSWNGERGRAARRRWCCSRFS
jgi:hypothetical protein